MTRATALDRPLLATFLMLGRVEVVELLAAAGFDAVILDLEHGAVEIADLPALTAAARSAGIAAFARLGDRDPGRVARVLDAGVDGIIAPHVDDAGQAAELVGAARFPPDGTRSLNPYVRGLGYGAGAPPQPAVVAMVESAGALADVHAICATPGLDGVFVGRIDLAGSLGVPGEPEHPRVREAVATVLAAAAEHGVAVGAYAPTPDAARRDRADGLRLVVVSADLRMALEGFARVRRETAGEAPV